MGRWNVPLLVVALASPAPEATTPLRFVRDGREVAKLDAAAMAARCAPVVVSVDDPYYKARKRFRGCPLREVLALGFGAAPAADADVFFRALDGYTKVSSGARIAEDGGYVAWADADRDGGFAPMGRQGTDPGPYYVVWTGAAQSDPHRYPWPFQLATIEIADFARTYPHTIPRTAAPDTPPWTGFAVFKSECIACHAINGEGGTVGPDLNVPKSIVEYRPTDQLKAYIRNPAAFRYGNMPAHPDLTDAQLDGLIAYFETMRALKHDPGPR